MEECPDNKKHKIVMIEYSWDSPQHYDGVSEIYCETDKKRFGRWCLKVLKKGERENRFCDGKTSHKEPKKRI
jgi:hypothetical protein